jgi:hypothetical protein
MKYRYLPEQIDAIESFRESPYCSMFGCVETERVAQAVVRWLIANGNSWDALLPDLTTIANERDLMHSHTYLGDGDELTRIVCDFARTYTDGDNVNTQFVHAVHRGTDGMRLSQGSLNTLRPDLFPVSLK